MAFADRREAGRQLAQRLAGCRVVRPVVLALPRGGVPVAYEVALTLDAPLDVIVVRKLGVPFHRELAMGAVGEDGVRVVDRDVLAEAGTSERELWAVEQRERSVLDQRIAALRAAQPRQPLDGCTAVVVDDGVATGSTARAACQVARAHGAGRVLLAVPVGAPESLAALRSVADEVVALAAPADFRAVGEWYEDFSEVTDADVADLLGRARQRDPRQPHPPGAVEGAGVDVVIPVGAVGLPGRLTVPGGARGVVAFAHGSGSSRSSPRNHFVARTLEDSGVATLLFDLLTASEEGDRTNVFDIALLGDRLVQVTRWLHGRDETRGLGIGYFGASTGAAAALWAAADPTVHVDAVVSRGGRPDLAGSKLPAVRAPTLLVVGGADTEVLALNRRAAGQLRCEHALVVVPGATHLFAEEGTLATVADEAAAWFVRHLTPAARLTG